MRRWGLLIVGMVLISVAADAGSFLINEADAYGLRVTFTEPVTITHVEGAFPSVTPEGEGTEFTFFGSKLDAWVGFGMLWTPASARILDHEWLSTPPTVAEPEGPAPVVPEPEPGAPPAAEPTGPPVATPVLPPIATPEPEPAGPAEVPTIAFDWTAVEYALSYPQGADILGRVLQSGTEVPVDRAPNWGLAGSEIKALQLSYVHEGLFLRIESWGSVQGAYAYAVAFRPLSSNYEAFEVGVDPESGDVWATTPSGIDLAADVRLVSLEDDRLVLFVFDALLPGGASISSTQSLWDRVLVLYYGAGRSEAYELLD